MEEERIIHTVGIIGYGTVGKATHNMLPKIHNVSVSDPALGFDDDQGILDSDAAFVCVPTLTQGGIQDMGPIHSVLRWLYEKEYEGLVVIRSSVLPENAHRLTEEYELNLMVSPEFLDQANPYKGQGIHVLGISDVQQARMYMDLFGQGDHVGWGFGTPIQSFKKMDIRTACMVKYVHNVYGVMKVSFFHEIADICESNKIDYREMMRNLLQSTNHIGETYTKIALDGKKGFGGKCFPDNVIAFNKVYPTKTLTSAIEYNRTVRPEEMTPRE